MDQKQITGAGHYSRPIKHPKNIQEGTANRVQLIVNEIEAGNPGEALYQAVDLLDELVCGALVVTVRVPPLDAAAMAKLIEEAEARGFERGKAEGYRQGQVTATRQILSSASEALNKL